MKLSQIKRWICNYVLPHKCKLIKYNTNTIFIHECHSNIASDTKMTTSKCTNLPPCQIFNNWPVFSKQTHNATHSLNVTHKNINHRNEETIIMISTMYMISQWHSLDVILRKIYYALLFLVIKINECHYFIIYLANIINKFPYVYNINHYANSKSWCNPTIHGQ